MIENIPLIIGGIVGMVGYILLNKSGLNTKGKHRCNCRNKVMKIKKAQKIFNDSLK